MKFTALQRHGLKLIMFLVKANDGQPVQAPEIADRESLKVGYVGKILFMLRHAGLVKAVRGRKGGYTLSKNKEEITLYDVLKALEVKEFEDECPNLKLGDNCSHTIDCSLRPVMKNLENYIKETTSSVSMKDLEIDEKSMYKRLQVSTEK